MRIAIAWFGSLVAISALACSGGGGVTVEPDPDMQQPTSAAPGDTAPVAPGTVAPDASGPKVGGPGGPGGKQCTMMGCIDGFHVDVEPAVQPKGSYEIAVEADGKKLSCKLTLPLPACDKGRAAVCTGDAEVMISESGCALPPDKHGFGPLNFKGAPAKVDVTVKRNGKELAKGSFSPAYKTVEPNGPGCGPICKQAQDKLTLK